MKYITVCMCEEYPRIPIELLLTVVKYPVTLRNFSVKCKPQTQDGD